MHPVTEADLPASGIELVDGGAGRRLREVGDGGPDRISDLEGKGLGGGDRRVPDLKMLVGRPVADGRGLPVVPRLADALAREPGGTAEGVLPGPLVQTSLTHPVGLAGQVDLVSDLPVARPVWLRVPVGGAHLRPGEAAVWIRPERSRCRSWRASWPAIRAGRRTDRTRPDRTRSSAAPPSVRAR